MFQLVEIELCDLEGGGGRQKRHHRSLPVRISHNLEWRFCIPVAEAHVMLLAVTPDREVQPIAERVHDGNTHAMQSARDLIGVIVRRVLELAARMKLSHDDFEIGRASWRERVCQYG